MYATERQTAIERILDAEGRLVVVDLAERFDVTTETVRRDLAALEQRGVLQRVHGGAVAQGRSSTRETSISERIHERSDAKGRIARAALNLLGDRFNGSVLLDAGSTVGALAQELPSHLATRGGRADVVTHSFAHAPLLAEQDGIDLTLVGGRVRRVTGAAVGATTVAAIQNLRPDIAFLGTNGLSTAFGLSTPDPEEAAVKRAAVAAARRVVVLCDAQKFDLELLVSFAPLSALDVLVTDAAPPAALAEALERADIEVVQA